MTQRFRSGIAGRTTTHNNHRFRRAAPPPLYIAAPDQEHRLTARVSKQHGPVRNHRELDTLREVRPFEGRLLVTHGVLSCAAAASAKM